MKKIVGFFSILILMVTIACAEPTIHQVYEAAQAGKLTEAHTMIEEVLKEHPKSAKAHFVNAEILSAQGQITQARKELKVAEELEPALSFAKPQAIATLKDNLGLNSGTKPLSNEHQGATSQNKPFPWTMVLIVGGCVLLIIFLIKSALTKNTTSQNNGFNGTPPSPYNSNTPTMPPSPQGGGIGSGIASGLATGLAAGVGIAAGEALVHHFMDGSSTPNTGSGGHTPTPPVEHTSQTSSDFGGNDFGITDSSSWDDSSSGDSINDSSSDSW